jgi:hypothetical protein
MVPELQNCFEEFSGPFEILEELKTMFQTQARSERYAISEKFFNCKMKGVPLVSTPLRCRATLNALSN